MAEKDNENTRDLKYMEETLMEMFRGNNNVYKKVESIDQRKEFRRIAADLTSAILEVRRQRMFEEGDVDMARSTTSTQYTHNNKRVVQKRHQ